MNGRIAGHIDRDSADADGAATVMGRWRRVRAEVALGDLSPLIARLRADVAEIARALEAIDALMSDRDMTGKIHG